LFMFLLAGCLLIQACSNPKEPTLFEKVEGTTSGIVFSNDLSFDKEFNIYTYRNFYNGGGVALGDLNNDGLLDVYLTANMKNNALFLNKGSFQFEEITESAGVAGSRSWATGVAMIDINADGFLDIYVSNSGDVKGDNKQNELFINNGDLTFTEKAEEFGLADAGFSTQASFFDYDKDGDLDLYLLNNSYRAIGSFNLQFNERSSRDEVGGDKLYRNDSGKFTDVSAEAGIYGSIIGFGLGVTITDVNRDGWQDMYVSNDFFERDYLYINNQDGTFEEVLVSAIQSISGASMGSDAADINHDGYPEIFVTEMLPEPEERLKTVTTFESWDKYQFSLANGYYHQFTRNMFQLNNTDGTFSEIGRYSGVEATDWSWAALMADLDQNGYTDLFVANGIYQDLTDQDYIQYVSSSEIIESVTSGENVDYQKLIDLIPSEPVSNYAFSGDSGLVFTNKADAWGLDEPGFSNGSAYGDLDNDGDLDLVVNNVNRPAFVYKNRANELALGNWLQVQLHGEGGNLQAVGAQLSVWANGRLYWREQMLQRGFQSSVDPRLHIGLGTASVIDSLQVVWADGRISRMLDVPVNQQLSLHQSEAVNKEKSTRKQEVKPLLTQAEAPIDFTHIENTFVDFDRDRLVFHMRSTEGPAGCQSANGEYVYAGGAKDQPGTLARITDRGWISFGTSLLEEDALAEDIDCVFFEQNGSWVLYVASGGNEFSTASDGLLDRLYGVQENQVSRLDGLSGVNRLAATGTVSAGDIDGDGDTDLFVGERLRPFAYGEPVNGRLLLNDGSGKFADVTETIAPHLSTSGMYTGSTWADIDGDGDSDLITAGEWMPIQVHLNERTESGEVRLTAQSVLSEYTGWWNEVLAGDFDGDGAVDLLGLNHGLNSRFEASFDQPASLWVGDFDGNGSTEQILSMYNGAASYPMVLRHDLVNQLPGLKKKYLKYEAYKEQTMEDIFTPQELEQARKLEVTTLQNMIFWGDGEGGFSGQELPWQAQLSPMFTGATIELDGVGNQEIMMGGNLYGVKPEAGRYDASYGLVLRIGTDRIIEAFSAKESGFRVNAQIRAIVPLEKGVWVLKNNAPAQWFFKAD
jgi:hypothetical protein